MASSPLPFRDTVVPLRDGRSIGVAEYGDPHGKPLVWFPGTPGSRLSGPPDEEATRSRGVRMITVERPGFGNSTPKPDRTIIDWADDFAQVADALDLHGFALAGTSGAGPYLCAAAWRLGERIRRVGLMGVVSPVTSPEVRAGLPLWRAASLAAARHWPSGVLKALRSRGLERDPEAFYRMLTRDAPPVDRRVIERIWDRQVRMTAEAVRQGLDAFVWELHLGAMPWGFDLGAVRTDVRLWHGEQDAATPIVMGRYLAEHLPRCRSHFLPDAGHFLHHDRWPDVLDMLFEA